MDDAGGFDNYILRTPPQAWRGLTGRAKITGCAPKCCTGILLAIDFDDQSGSPSAMPDGRFIVTQPSQPISVKTDEVRRTGSLTPGIAQCYGGEDARSHVFLHEES